MLSIVLLIVGGIAYTQLPVAQYPEIAPPTIVVRAVYPGADAETVAATVATPIEQEINGVEDMLYMSSYSSGDGSMALTITFELGTDLDQAQVLVQNRVAIAEPRLPEEVRRLGITTAKSSPDLMMVVHMLSPDDTYDQLYVSNYARSRVRDVLLRLDGVGDLIIFGEREYSLRIWLDPDKLSAYGMTAGDVVQALREQNVQVSGGSIGAPPTTARHRLPVHGHHAGPLRRRARLPLCHRQVDRGRPADHAAGRGAHRARRQGLRHQFLSQRQAGGGARHLPAAGHQRARRGRRRSRRRSTSSSTDFPPGLAYEIVYNPTEFIAEFDQRGLQDDPRGDRCWWSSSSSSSCSPGAWRSCRSWPSRCR